jgi:imidazolonepropionase-like amidohydrolase
MKRIRVTGALGAVVLGGSCAVHAQSGPIGTFRSAAITVEFTGDGKATFSNPRGLLIAASYRVVGDTIQLRDDSGPAACPGEAGRYLWRVEGDTLRFRLLNDACAGRRSAFATSWARVASALVLTGATVIDGTGAVPRAGMTLVLRDGIIAAMHPDGAAPVPAGADMKDARGQWIIPGLIDAHVHVATDPNGPDRRDRVERRLRNALFGGVVAVRDMGGDARALADLSRAAVTGQLRSPIIRYSAIMAGPEFFSDPRVRASSAGVALGSAPWARAIRPDEDFRQVVAEARGAGATGLKLYADLDSTRMARLAGEGKRQRLAIWAHAAMNFATPSATAGAGVEVMSHAVLLTREATPPTVAGSGRPPFDYRITAEDAAIRRAILAMKQHGVIFEPTLFVFRAPPEAADTSMARRREQRAAEFTRAVRAAGIPILAGTDGLGGEGEADVPNIHEEMRLLVEQAGLSPMEALLAATATSAKVLRIDSTHGTLAIGKAADLLLLSADPLVDIRNTKSIVDVIQRGRFIRR